MKKEMNQKVKLSKTAKKVLAGVLAASMVFSGTMTSFVKNPETVNAEEAATKEAATEEATPTAIGLEIVKTNKKQNNAVIGGNSEDRLDTVKFGEAGEYPKGIEVKNPFAGKDEINASMMTALERSGQNYNGLIFYDANQKSYQIVQGELNGFAEFEITNKKKINFKDWDKSSEGDLKMKVYNRETMQQAYDLAYRKMLEATPDAIDILKKVASGDATVSAGWQNDSVKHLAEVISAAAVTGTIPSEEVGYVYWGGNRGGTNPGNPADVSGDFVYPLPVWEEGITISTWVKVPEDAAGAAPIFSFSATTGTAVKDDEVQEAGMTLRTDGQFVFTGNIVNNACENVYAAIYDGDTPLKNKGNWVYVTLTVKNDEVNVYYNGKKATEKLDGSNSKLEKKGGKQFNGGFAFASWGEARVETLLQQGWYPQLFQSYTTKGESVDFSDVSKYTYKTGTAAMLMMELVTLENTKFYLGGDDGSTLYSGQLRVNNKREHFGMYNANNKGMELDNMTTADYVMDEKAAKEAYETAKDAVKNEFIELIKLENEEFLAEKAKLKAAIAAKKAAEELALAEAETKMAADVNAVSVTAVDAEGSSATVENGVVTFDRIYGITGEAAGVGVYLDNPFEGKYELAETYADALSGQSVNALTSHIEYKNNGLYMHLKYAEFKGFKLADVKKKVKDASGNEVEKVVGKKIQLDAPEKDLIKNKATAISAYEKAEAAMKAATGQATEMIKLVEASPEWYQWDNARVKELATKIINNTLTDQDIVFTWEGARFIGLPNHEKDVNPTPAAIEGEISYPVPKYNKGVTISTWVKVKKGTKWSAPIFSFENGNDGLVLRTDGTVVFADNLINEKKNPTNLYNAKYTGFTPFDNQDTWVYVTMTIKNDEIHVYYNGEEAKENLFKNITKVGGKYAKKFNGGFGLAAWGASADERKLLSNGTYPQLLENYESGDTDFTDVSKYSFSTRWQMMDLLVNPATEFYIGGGNNTDGLRTVYGGWIINDGSAYVYPGYDVNEETWPSWNKCTTFNSGLKVADISTLDYVVNATEAKALFNIQESRDYIKAEESGFEVKNLNADENNATEGTATVGTDEIKVITLGKHNDDEVDYAKGVELVNPFKGKTELSETVAEAFKNNGKTFSGLTYTITKDVSEDTDGDGVGDKVVGQETYKRVATAMDSFAGFRITYNNQGNWLDGKEKSGSQFWDGNDPNGKKDPWTENGKGLQSYVIREKAAFVTKADALYAYNTARDFLLKNNYIGSDGYAAQWLEEASAAGMKMQTDFVTPYAVKLASIERAEDLTPAAVQYIYDGPARNPEGNLTDITTVKDEFSYPMPKWKKGVTISTWVKVPETAQWSTPIYTFANAGGVDGLTLRTDGTLMYLADGAGSGDEKNYFVANYAGDTPYAKKGEWVYVTLSVKNDEFNVYYNGKKATETISSQIEGAGKNAGVGFNYGFVSSNSEDRLKNLLLGEAAYADLLKNFDVNDTNYSDVTKYNVAYDTTSVMEFLTATGTKLYVGGYCKSIYSNDNKIYDVNKVTNDPVTGKQVAWGGYSDHAEGMQVGGFSFGFEPISDSEARMLYNDTQLEDEIDVPYSDEPSATPAPTASVKPAGTEDTKPVATASVKPAGTEDTKPVATASVKPAGTEDTKPAASTAPSEDIVVTPSVSPSAPAVKLGDVDGNGSVELKDAQAALKIALKIEKNPTTAQIAAGDIDKNGTVELKDAQAILKEALKITENFKAK